MRKTDKSCYFYARLFYDQLLRSGRTALFIPPEMAALGINRQIYSKVVKNLAALMDEKDVYTKQDLRLDDLAAILLPNGSGINRKANNK